MVNGLLRTTRQFQFNSCCVLGGWIGVLLANGNQADGICGCGLGTFAFALLQVWRGPNAVASPISPNDSAARSVLPPHCRKAPRSDKQHRGGSQPAKLVSSRSALASRVAHKQVTPGCLKPVTIGMCSRELIRAEDSLPCLIDRPQGVTGVAWKSTRRLRDELRTEADAVRVALCVFRFNASSRGRLGEQTSWDSRC